MRRHRWWWKVLGAVVAVSVLSGCNRFGYDADLDGVAVVNGAYVQANGWLHDPYPSRAQRCPAIRWVVDGITQGVQPCPSFGSRPDVDAALGGANAAISFTVYGLTQGRHDVCVDVVSPEAIDSEPFRPLDCGSVSVPWDQLDRSALDGVSVNGSTVDASGWYSLIIRSGVEATWTRTWSYDGLLIADASGPTFTTGTVARPDAAARYGPSVQGMTLRAAGVPAGRHELCLGVRYPGTNYLSGVISCRSFTV